MFKKNDKVWFNDTNTGELEKAIITDNGFEKDDEQAFGCQVEDRNSKNWGYADQFHARTDDFPPMGW